MADTKSTTDHKSNSTVEASAESIAQKDTTPCRRVNMKIVQSVILIWLDANIDQEKDPDCQNTITQLHRVINSINTFTDGSQFLDFIETIDSNNHKACIVISGSLGEHVVPRVHHMLQVDSLFIFCKNKQYHQQWARDWSKIKGVFTEIAPICEALIVATKECEHNAIPMSFMPAAGGDGDDDNAIQKKVDQLDCSFMYTQILKDILLIIKFGPEHIQEFIDYCREQFAENLTALIDVEKIGRNYHNQTPVWWYTCESFLYPMLNTALRLMDVDMMIRMGFFISDLHRQIDELYKEQFGDRNASASFTIYRGQSMSKKDFQKMNEMKGGLIAFNCFLSTSKAYDVSLNFASRALSNPALVGVLFVMMIDPSQSTTPFASVNNVSFYNDDEDEVLFSMHSVFRIRDIKSMNEDNCLYQVDLALTSDNDKDLRALTDRLNEEIAESTGWDRLGYLLLKMWQLEKAEQVYQYLLEQPSNEIEKATFYHRLAWAIDGQGAYEEALALYQEALAMRQQLLPSTHSDLAMSYNNIGLVYYNLDDCSEALSSHKKALAIRQQSLPSNHPHLAMSYNNIGIVYSKMGDYSKALSSHEKALEIRQQSLPPTHPELAMSYNNIGSAYSNMNEYSKALSHYEKALAVRQKSLPPTHLDIAMSYNNIGNMYDSLGDYPKAISCHEEALKIRQQSLPQYHPALSTTYNNLGVVYKNMGDYSKARSFFKFAVEIAKECLPPDHPSLEGYIANLDSVENL